MDFASGFGHPQTTSVGIYTLSRRLRLDADQGLRHAVYAAGYPTVWAKVRKYSTRKLAFSRGDRRSARGSIPVGF